MNTIGRRLVAIRKDKNLTQTELGRIIGLKQTAIGQYETEKRNVTEQSIQLLREKLNINEHWLRTGEGEMYNPVTGEDEVAALVYDLLQGDKTPVYELIVDIMKIYKELDPKSREVLDGVIRKVRDADNK